jgi:hypothetical protein
LKENEKCKQNMTRIFVFVKRKEAIFLRKHRKNRDVCQDIFENNVQSVSIGECL